jgi:hypothetical protein
MTAEVVVPAVADRLRAAFEREFHSRTLAYLPGFRDAGRPVVVALGDGAHRPAGHALAHALINQLARAHRKLVFVGNWEHELLCPSLFGCSTLQQATVGLARAINPYIELEVVADVDISDRLLSLGVGPAGADIDLGADRWRATLGPMATIGADRTSMIGASLAACLGAHAAFAALTGVGRAAIGTWSAWRHLTSSREDGPDLDGPIDVGGVLCAGAGGVGSALAFFSTFTGLAGDWMWVDGDAVDISNLNRQVAFVAADAGWPEGPAANKAQTIARRLGGSHRSSPAWYGADATVSGAAYDLVLALANERGVRRALAHRQPTVLLHATTSANWQAQWHRHVAGHDDCINCRLPGEAPALRCSTAPIPVPGSSVDAALPFLSAMAGLMLLVALAQLTTGRLLDVRDNYVAIDFRAEPLTAQSAIHVCRRGCQTRLPAPLRAEVDRQSSWRLLDPSIPSELRVARLRPTASVKSCG